MVGKRRQVNEKFFDEKSKEMWYVLAACYNGYTYEFGGFKFTHSSKRLVKIVGEALGSNHSITDDTRGKNSHWIAIEGVPYLYQQLGKLGLNEPKSERKPPEDLGKLYFRHFARGFLESRRGWMRESFGDSRNNLYVRYNHDFLVWFNHLMRDYADVDQKDPKEDVVIYQPEDTLRIHELCYSTDWKYTKDSGLYLKSYKKPPVIPPKPEHLYRVRQHRRIAISMPLLDDFSVQEVSEITGYSSQFGFYRAFKHVTGLTVDQFKEFEPEERKLFM